MYDEYNTNRRHVHIILLYIFFRYRIVYDNTHGTWERDRTIYMLYMINYAYRKEIILKSNGDIFLRTRIRQSSRSIIDGHCGGNVVD